MALKLDHPPPNDAGLKDVTQNLMKMLGPIDKSILKVHLENRGFHTVRFGDATDIKVKNTFYSESFFKPVFTTWLILKGIIQLLTVRLGDGYRTYNRIYAMRLFNSETGDVLWFHQDTTMFQVFGDLNEQ